jgi:hypothetical protein
MVMWLSIVTNSDYLISIFYKMTMIRVDAIAGRLSKSPCSSRRSSLSESGGFGDALESSVHVMGTSLSNSFPTAATKSLLHCIETIWRILEIDYINDINVAQQFGSFGGPVWLFPLGDPVFV